MNNYKAKLIFLFFQKSNLSKILKIFFSIENELDINTLLLNKQAMYFQKKNNENLFLHLQAIPYL